MDEEGSSNIPMDLDDSSTRTRRKVRFAPKGPPPRRKKTVAPKTEESDEADEEAARALLRRVNEKLGRRESKDEKKSAVHVTFGQRSEISAPIRTWGRQEGTVLKTDDPGLQNSAPTKQLAIFSPSTSGPDEMGGGGPVVGANTSQLRIKNEYKEPWDYNHSYYPTTLPLRRPYSGDPELLDEAEFGAGAAEYDEDLTNSAAELGLLDENENAQMLFFQLPPNLPLVGRRARVDEHVAVDNPMISKVEDLRIAKGEEIARSSAPPKGAVASAKAKGKGKVDQQDPGVLPGATEMEIVASAKAKGKEKVDNENLGVSPVARGMEIVGNPLRKRRENLESLPAGYMGKMLVYKSGAVKLKLGDILFDVSPGARCIFAQDAVAINTVDKECCFVGEIERRAIVTPDISLYDNVVDLT